jgi:hypothetical protein
VTKSESQHKTSRREILKATLRYGTLGLLTATAVGLLAKRRKLLREGKCIGNGFCNGCKILERCNLEQAVKTRGNFNNG